MRSDRTSATAAWAKDLFAGEIVSVPGDLLVSDENVRADTTLDALASLKPSFRPAGVGTVTAGNSSPLNEGAAMVLLGGVAGIPGTNLEPLARITGRGIAGCEPNVFGIAPVDASNQALTRAGRT